MPLLDILYIYTKRNRSLSDPPQHNPDAPSSRTPIVNFRWWGECAPALRTYHPTDYPVASVKVNMSTTTTDGQDANAGGPPCGAATTTESPRDQLFAQFVEVSDLSEVLSVFEALRAELGVPRDAYESVYPTLKRELTSWKCRAVWQLLDARAAAAEYAGQAACAGRNVLVVGAGPVGLRAAVEAAMLGARVDVVEKRGGFSRNNSLHLWPFVITDLRNLGAKKFYGKFSSGSIDHICKLTAGLKLRGGEQL